MAKNNYKTQGAAAYDVRYAEIPAILPEDQQKPVRVRRIKASVSISPFSVLGILAAVFLAVLVIFGYVRLYEADSQLTDLQSQLSDLQYEQGKLQTQYENQLNLSAIEERATALGMTQPKASQTVYVNLNGVDRAEITPAQHQNLFATVFQAIRDSVTGFVEYLS